MPPSSRRWIRAGRWGAAPNLRDRTLHPNVARSCRERAEPALGKRGLHACSNRCALADVGLVDAHQSDNAHPTESRLGGTVGCLVSEDQQVGNVVSRMFPGSGLTGGRQLPIRLPQTTEVYDLRQVVEIVLARAA